MRCDRCDADAVVDRPYAGDHLCADHFRRSVTERFRREMHRQLPRVRGGVVAVALSGGKDSAVTLALAHRHFARRPTVRLVALSVDEGIAGYRPATLARAAELCGALGVEHRVVASARELGVTTDRAARAPDVGGAPCSACGVWRRRLLNDAARRAGADALLLGFNLDDLAQTVLMNLVRADVARLARLAPHRGRQPGLVPRVAPLASVPEREVYLYATLARLPFDHGECPHAARGGRNLFRETVWRLEAAIPGTRHALLRTHAAIVDLLAAAGPPTVAGRCAACGGAATGPVCRSCAYLKSLDAPPLGEVGP